MRKILTFILMILSLTAFSQDTIQQSSLNARRRNDMNVTYHRSSWHNILLYHSDQKYAEAILETYYNRPQSEKFNDHSLQVDVLKTKGKKYAKFKKVNKYIMNNGIANDLVAKWFNRNASTGCCDMNLIYMRGLQSATTEQIETSELAKRGKAILMDSGVDLIGNTFVLVHDIIYVDKGERNKKTANGFRAFGNFLNNLGEAMAYATGDYSYMELGRSANQLSRTTADIVDDYEGFRVKIKTHLYRLNWQDSDNDFFYENYYLDEDYYDEAKFHAWQNANYQLSYVGSQEVACGETVLTGKYDLSQLIKIIVYRTLDECIVKLQRNYEEFKVKEPIYDIDEAGNVIAKIGLKEGVSEQSRYEVLERVETADGTTKYRKVGEIKPIADKIWDNRYMALEDGAANSELEGTHFKVTSGRNLYPGLLIREIKF